MGEGQVGSDHRTKGEWINCVIKSNQEILVDLVDFISIGTDHHISGNVYHCPMIEITIPYGVCCLSNRLAGAGMSWS